MGYLEHLDGWLPSLDAYLIFRVLFGHNLVGNREVTLSYQGHFTKLCYFGDGYLIILVTLKVTYRLPCIVRVFYYIFRIL